MKDRSEAWIVQGRGVAQQRPPEASQAPRFRRGGSLVGALVLLVGLAACRTAQPVAAPDSAPEAASETAPDVFVRYTTVSDSLAEDPALEALVAPYRAQMAAQVSEVIGVAPRPLTEDQPEGALGQFAADAMLAVAQEHVEGPLHMALTNAGGLRVPIPAGPVTVGLMFELMPFENRLVVLELTGVQVDSLAQQLARINGEPIAGLSFQLLATSRRAVQVEVQGAAVVPDAQYFLVTSDYLADGGGYMPAIWEPVGRRDLPLLLRDAFIEYARRPGTLDHVFEPRIHVVHDDAFRH